MSWETVAMDLKATCTRCELLLRAISADTPGGQLKPQRPLGVASCAFDLWSWPWFCHPCSPLDGVMRHVKIVQGPMQFHTESAS